MNFSNHRNENQPNVFCPSDEDLIDYLLGTSVRNDKPDAQASSGNSFHPSMLAAGREPSGAAAPDGLRRSANNTMESWLAADPRHVERLEAFAISILFSANESAAWTPPTAAQFPDLSSKRTLQRYVRVAVAVALAASILFAVTFLNSQRPASRTDDRVAMAWADSLSLADSDETTDEVAAWLLQQSPDLEGDDELDGDDSDSPGFGFDSSEPPEWLLTAVMGMQANGAVLESGEAIQ